MLNKSTHKLVVGLTGHFATGKSTFAHFFAKHEYEVIEVDQLGHQALIDKKEDIIKQFGKNILNQHDAIDRKKLAKLVFQDPEQLKKLETIVHPWMVQLVEAKIQNSSSLRILISAAILIEMNLHLLCDKVIIITASEENIMRWGSQRDNLTKEDIKQRLKNQLPLKSRQVYADFIIDNKDNLDDLYNQARKLLSELERCKGDKS